LSLNTKKTTIKTILKLQNEKKVTSKLRITLLRRGLQSK